MGIITALLRRPSQRTNFEATLTGLSVFLIVSLVTPIYVIFFSNSLVWIKILTGLGGIAIILMLFSNLSMTYIQYYTFKMQMGMYTTDKKLLIKIEEARKIKKELESLIKENKSNNLIKLNKGGKNVR